MTVNGWLVYTQSIARLGHREVRQDGPTERPVAIRVVMLLQHEIGIVWDWGGVRVLELMRTSEIAIYYVFDM